MAEHVIYMEREKGENLPISTEPQPGVAVSPDVKKDIEEKARSLCVCIKKCYDLKQQVERIEKHGASLT
ncbi:Hypothetical predicted protein, partial [Cloeon dipterum]